MFGEKAVMQRSRGKINRYHWKYCFVLVFLAMTFLPLHCYSKDNWQLLYQPRQRVVRSIGVYEDKIFIGTGNGILISRDKGKTWEDFGTVQLLKNINGFSSINWIYIDDEKKKIYIATSLGAYYSDIAEPDWHNFFENIKTESYQVNSLTVNADKVYLSTDDGFWIYDLVLGTCDRMNQGLEPDSGSGNFQAFYSLSKDDMTYLAASNGVYVFDEKKMFWKNITFSIDKLPDGKINSRYILDDDKGNLWIACGTGVYRSNNNGLPWINSSEGIGRNADGFQGVFYLFFKDDILFSATESGIYSYDSESQSWTNLSYGIRTKESSKNVYWLAGIGEELYAATDEGLFVLREPRHEAGSTKQEEQNNKMVLKGTVETGFAGLSELEPSVIEVQKQALKFASLPTANDYKRYRLEARLRNVFPKVGFDLNNTGTSTNYYQLNKGITSDALLNNDFNSDQINRHQFDGRSFKQVSLLWDANKFLYDDEIGDILSQARLTANIRENLLDDVTRIYYQRRKVQLEILLSPPKDIQTKLAKEIEIAELTGQLDSRTGGWFTRQIERRKKLEVSDEKL